MWLRTEPAPRRRAGCMRAMPKDCDDYDCRHEGDNHDDDEGKDDDGTEYDDDDDVDGNE